MYELYIQDTNGTFRLADLGTDLPAINIHVVDGHGLACQFKNECVVIGNHRRKSLGSAAIACAHGQGVTPEGPRCA